MNFKKLEKEQQEQLHIELLTSAISMGGKNFFLQMVESVKEEEFPPLLNKNKMFSFPNAKLLWNKLIYKDTLELLIASMKKEEKDGDILSGLEPKEYRKVMNMMRTLKPIHITVKPKKAENGKGFTISILDTTENRKTKFSPIFKAIFLFNTTYSKDVLNFKSENSPDLEEITALAENKSDNQAKEVIEVETKKKKKKRTREYKAYTTKKKTVDEVLSSKE